DFSLCSSCSCLFRCLSDSIPPRSIFASLELLLPSCCCSFPFPRVHLSKSLANSRRFLLTSCLACSNLIACCSCLCPIFLESDSIDCVSSLLSPFPRSSELCCSFFSVLCVRWFF